MIAYGQVLQQEQNGQINKPTLYILAIGVSKYEKPELQKGVQLAAKDAEDFTKVMLRQKGLLYKNVEIKLLTDENANTEEIKDGFQWLTTEVTQHDVAIIFMAGHGENDNFNRFYFLPYKGNKERLNATCISSNDIVSTLNVCPGKKILFIDACYSGNVLGQRNTSLNQALTELTNAKNGTIVFTSSTSDQYSYENLALGNGVFTKAVVEGLIGKAVNKENQITVKSLDYYVTERVKILSERKQATTTTPLSSIPDFPIAWMENETIQVTNITGLPNTVIQGSTRKLTGTAEPANATNKNITWSIVNTGGTGANITGGNTLIAHTPGTVIVRGTIENGISENSNYTQDFKITVEQTRIAPIEEEKDVTEHLTYITGVATTAITGISLTLNGKVTHENATTKNIKWSVANAGGTNAYITDDNTLKALTPGIVIVRATIDGGERANKNYTQDFTITVLDITTTKNLTNKGHKVYQQGQRLTKEQVRGLMMNTEALKKYNEGISKRRNRIICLLTGVGLIGGGTYLWFVYDNSYVYGEYVQKPGGGYYLTEGGWEKEWAILPSVVGILAGVGMVTTVISTKNRPMVTVMNPSNSTVDMYIKQSVDMYILCSGINCAIKKLKF